MINITHSDSTVSFEEIQFHMWGYNLTCNATTASSASNNMYVMVKVTLDQSTENHRFYQKCSIESLTTEDSMDVCFYKCACQGRCNTVYLRAVGDDLVTLCEIEVFGSDL